MAGKIQTLLSLPEQYHTRLNIKDLHEKKPLQFSLYVLALDLIKKSSEDTDNPYGWFQYNGIHGLPNVMWNKDPTPIINNTDELFGYCTHASALFPLWHRIFVWQLERTITEVAKGIVLKAIGEKTIHPCTKPKQCATTPCVPACAELWTEAANELRMPYWDWVREQGQMPPVLNQDKVQIQIPGKGPMQTANPLVNYHFQKKETVPPPNDVYWFQEPYASQWPKTLRCPDANGVAHPELANEQLGAKHWFRRIGETANLTEYVYMLLSAIHEYIPFSNTAYADRSGQPGSLNYASIEDVHNSVHVFVGAYAGFGSDQPGGHMSLNEYAAFDPIFWLHHCNVDRIFAIWQQLNPDATFKEPYAGSGSGVSKVGTMESVDTNLVPFIQEGTGGKYWNSELIQHWYSIYKLGYIYPETNPVQPTPEGRNRGIELASDWVEKLYGPDAGKVLAGAPAQAPPAWEKGKVHRREWQVTSRIKRFEVEGSFHIHFFLGPVPNNPSEWLKPTAHCTYVGSNTIFLARHGCSKCDKQKKDEKYVTGVVPLTRTLCDRPGNYDMEDEQEIEQYLKKELSWRVQKSTGEEVPLDKVPSLLVAVTSTPVTLTVPFYDSGAAKLPHWDHAGAKVHPAVTVGRRAGLDRPDQY